MSESKREKFKRLANSRVNRVLSDIHLIGNLSSKKNYEYTEADVKQIFAAINASLRTCRSRFESETTSESEQFKIR